MDAPDDPYSRLKQPRTVTAGGNPQGSAIGVYVAYGTNLPEPSITVPEFGVVVIDITQGNTMVRLEPPGALSVVAQLAVDTGKTTVMTYLQPLQ